MWCRPYANLISFEQTVEWPTKWDALTLMSCHPNEELCIWKQCFRLLNILWDFLVPMTISLVTCQSVGGLGLWEARPSSRMVQYCPGNEMSIPHPCPITSSIFLYWSHWHLEMWLCNFTRKRHLQSYFTDWYLEHMMPPQNPDGSGNGLVSLDNMPFPKTLVYVTIWRQQVTMS